MSSIDCVAKTVHLAFPQVADNNVLYNNILHNNLHNELTWQSRSKAYVRVAKNTFVLKVVPLVLLWVLPAMALIGLFWSHTACLKLVVLLLVGLFFASYASYPAGHWKLALGPCLMLGLLLALYTLNWVSIRVFSQVAGLLAMAVTVLVSLLSAMIGQRQNVQAQEILMACALLAPLLCAAIYIMSGLSTIYVLGLLASVTASGVNIFFNKSTSSIGLPT